MVVMRGTYERQLSDRARLAFTMVNLADAAGRRRMVHYPKDAIFGSFRVSFVEQRLKAAYPRASHMPPPLGQKQLDRIEADERYRANVIADQTPSLTNYEQGQYLIARRRNPAVERASFVGCREKAVA